MQRFILVVLAVALCPALALARSWTNREGKEIVADFVDATDEKVTLKKSDGKVVTFKLELLCDDDQQFIRGILARRVGKKPTPTEEPGSPFETAPSSAAPPTNLREALQSKESDEKVEGLGTMRDVHETKKKMKIENREWTDASGNTTSGKFIRFQGNSVLVLRGGRQATLDYWQLSDADQEYLKEVAEANGIAHLVPKVNPATRNNGPNTALAGGQPVPNMPAAPGARFPGPVAGNFSPPPAGQPAFGGPEDLARRMRELEEKARTASTTSTYSPPTTPPPGATTYSPPSSPAAPGTSYSPPGMSSPGPAMPGSSYTPPSYTPPSSAMPSSSMPMPSMHSMPDPMFSAPTVSFEKQCENCGRVLPASTTAGDSCPGCGVYFSVDRTTGKTASAWGSGGGSGGGGMSRGAFRGIAVLVVVAIKAIAFIAWRSQQS